MTAASWLVLVVVAATVALLAKDVVAPSIAVIGGVIVLLVAGVISPAEAFSGFSNTAPITVAAMYVIARAVEKTGALQPIVNATLGGGGGERMGLARLLVPAAGASAFLNNTPIVAMLVPQVTEWAERRGKAPSTYLMPLSFAVILGGVITVIGTSTNLVVSGLLESVGQPPIGMFEMSGIGLPVAAAGIALVIVLAPVLLPKRQGARRDIEAGVREFVVAMKVVAGGPLDGQAVEAGGLRHLQGVFLAEVERGGEVIAPVAPTMVLRGNDKLTFVGRADLVVDLQMARGLESAEAPHMEKLDTARHTFFEAVIGTASPLVGMTLKEAGFRSRYQAAVVAVHRAGERVAAKLGTVELAVGDTLVLLTDPGFRDRWRDRSDFLLISRLGGTPPAITKKAWLVWTVLLGVVVVAGLGLVPILQSALVGAVLLVVFGVLTPGEARSSVDLDVLIVIAGAFGLGEAILKTGLAESLAHLLVGVSAPLGEKGALLGIILATVLLTELITNNAAAALMFPIAMAIAVELGLDGRPIAIAIAIAASASFLTPIGYQTNTMVYGPGGYRFGDYVRLGLPLTIGVIAALMMFTRLGPG